MTMPIQAKAGTLARRLANARRLHTLPARILLAILATLIVAVVLLLITGAWAKARLVASYPPPGQMVDVGGYRLHLYCIGEGSPTVLFEAGNGGDSLLWAHVQPRIAQPTRVCAYDRAGLGWSDASPHPRTANVMVAELHTLLTNANITGPYVLVGHSLGGALMRLYQRQHPESVVGMVLVDSAHEQQMERFPAAYRASADPAKIRQMLTVISGLIRTGIPALAPRLFASWLPLLAPPILPEGLADAYLALRLADPKVITAFGEEFFNIDESYAQIQAARINTLDDLPLVVLSHGRLDSAARMPADVAEETEQVWRVLQSELAALSTHSRHIVAEASGHNIQIDQPQLVVEAVEDVIAAAR